MIVDLSKGRQDRQVVGIFRGEGSLMWDQLECSKMIVINVAYLVHIDHPLQ